VGAKAAKANAVDADASVDADVDTGTEAGAEADAEAGADPSAHRAAAVKKPVSVWWATLGNTLGTAVGAAVLVALVDTVRTAWQVQLSLGGTGDLFLALLAFYATVGLILGGLEGVVAAGVRETFHRPFETHPRGSFSFRRLWARLKSDPLYDAKWAATVMAFFCVPLCAAGLVLFFHLSISRNYANETLVAVYLAGIAAIGVLVGTALFFPVRALGIRFWRSVARRKEIPHTVWSVALIGICGAGLLILALKRADWRMTNFGPLTALIALLVLQLLLLFGVSRLGGRLRRGLCSPLAVAAAGLVIIAGLSRAGRSLNENPRLRVATLDGSWTGTLLVGLGRTLTDRDGDGYSGYFGGGDCDDGNPRIHPGARDNPHDNIDQDCVGGDALPAKPPQRVAWSRLPASDPLHNIAFKGNFLFLFVDALRADRLGRAQYARNITPNIDRLIDQSVYFSRAYSQGNRTPQSFTALLTSRFPSRIRLTRAKANFPTLHASNVTLFERLRRQGYRNLAITRHYYFKTIRNLHQGFAPGDWVNRPVLSIDAQNEDISAPAITRRAIHRLQQLAQSKQRFSLLVHYHDPHHHYMPHPKLPITESGVAGLIQAYDYEIKFTDRHIGVLLAALRRLKLDENTTVVLFSDHGEAFGRRSFRGRKVFYHGHTLYNELIHVPLAFRIPTVSPRTVTQRVMLIDVAPTVLDLIRAPIPPAFMGASLLPTMVGRPLQPRIVRAESLPYANWTDHMIALIAKRFKLIYRVRDNIFELYDLKNDEQEQVNLSSSHPEVLARLKKRISN
jgi:arylsulfatase A-like enzyme